MYFDNFPLMYYKNGDEYKLAVDILRRVNIRKSVKRNADVYYEYDLKDSDMPETIAHKIYGDPNLHWIVLMANDMIDPFYDWILNQEKFKKYLKFKYGKGEEDKTHHYELEDGTWTNGPIYLETPEGNKLTMPDGSNFIIYDIQSNIGNPVPISNRQYEERINEEKRRIKLIKPDVIQDIIREFKQKINE